MKEYKLGLICGRFSHIHKGHQILIDKALELCDNILILVGSAQESGTLRNPFDADFRIELIKKVYQDPRIKIKKLNDMSNEYDISYEWGQYVIDNTKKYTGTFADLIVTGNDNLRKGWFSKEQMKKTTELIINRKKLDISATDLRGYLTIGDEQTWKRYVPEQILNDFQLIRKKLQQVPIYQEIMKKIGTDLTIQSYTKVYQEYEKEDIMHKMQKNCHREKQAKTL